MRLCPWGTTILFLCFESDVASFSGCIMPPSYFHLLQSTIRSDYSERDVCPASEQYTTAWPHLLVLCGQSVTTADIRFLVQQSPECIPGPSFISSPMALGLLSQRRLDWKLPAAALSLSQPGFFSSPNIISQQAEQHREKVQFSSGVHGTGTKPRNRRRLQLSGHPQVRGKVA